MLTKFPFLLIVSSILLIACGDDAQNSGATDQVSKPSKKSHPKRSDIEVGADGLVRLIGSEEPYSGPVIMGIGGQIGYMGLYEKGKQHGPEIRYHKDGVTLSKWFDWIHGEKVRSREFYENGQLKRDAMMKDGEAFGKHQTWTEGGMLKFDGNFTDNLRWHGHIRDLDNDGNVLWDAHFENGVYQHGIYPPEAEADLIQKGLIDPETKKPTKAP